MPDRTRTCYPRLRRPVLYPDELRAPRRTTTYDRYKYDKKNGRGDRIRTYDILVPNQARYRAALRPDVLILLHSLEQHTSNKRRRIIRGSGLFRQISYDQKLVQHSRRSAASAEEKGTLISQGPFSNPIYVNINYCGATSGACSAGAFEG